MARRMFPSRLELKSPRGSAKEARDSKLHERPNVGEKLRGVTARALQTQGP